MIGPVIPLALATMLVHLALAYPAQAQVPDGQASGVQDAQPAASTPVLDADATQNDGNNLLEKPTDLRSLCQTIASAAAQNGLPFEFFSRIIWQESRFNSGAIGPVTRGGQRAQGIAQFMPATASERSVRDPFDPFEALPKSAEFLRELQAQFGNLGLAAAAYNAGPQRVRDWLDGKRTLPSETQAYVQMVTGHSAQEWMLPKPTVLAVAVPAEMSCVESVGLTHKPQPSACPRAPPGPHGSLNSSATVRKRRPCPAFVRCKASFDLCSATTNPPFFERQSRQAQHPSGFAFASNLTRAKPPNPCVRD